jgi:hypothetical protein
MFLNGKKSVAACLIQGMGSAISLEACCMSRREGEEESVMMKNEIEVLRHRPQDDSAHLNRSVTMHEAS